MLAMASAGSASHGLTYVFDEIDGGVGGKVARRVGERLRTLGDGHQALCITHLPQVASLASTHFRISKSVAAGAARADVERLEDDALVGEICRMLGADEGDAAASEHARQLLQAA
jgi:DNA repair protein RecN (Recombination protein N)